MSAGTAEAAAPRAGALRVLVVEDDPRLLDILTRHLDRMGYAVRGAGGAAAALQLLEAAPADVVLSDVRMPGMDGRTLLAEVRARHPDAKVILMTAFGSVDDAVEAMQAGAYSYVVKPFKVETVAAVLRNAARELELHREVDGLRRAVAERFSADRLIGGSARMREVRRALREAAEVGATVLVTGRSGTGKEMAARAIHYGGPRAAGPFVAVNCAAIPEPLFESAMFGHRRGAFTGAVESQAGFVEQSSGGTLFLDEVAEIPPAQQAKLLRVLQEGEVTPVGAARPVKVDLRVVAAANRDLEQMVAKGAFREDLFYRLNVLRIELPTLAERAEDVPALAEHLLLDVARGHGVPALGFTPEALAALERHRWPGNVRELRNAVERALLAARGRRIDAADLPAAVVRAPAGAEAVPPPGEGGLTLAEVERAHVEKVLAMVGWNRSLAARLLGIDRRTLFTKIQRYGLIGPLRPGPGGGGDAEDEDGPG
ncbi:two component, sigma54 specific, transcriptional regulator, Fis family [Anaeromyxobacter sp. K]|uniref:sigma-54-dependent transcriptional regulator n=1 Tax=Anaeromyxobacter sp. (strain K) TaxID=447217 RepID=UPI00015F9A2C|nr:sigma-54 dependent transcriptional regulator [Anaeromyxobacter sp. K]ACG74997.1 two component, sigma54 specific, transcriptional regulator, Fis family [Anaeromyxobacter sp. K]